MRKIIRSAIILPIAASAFLASGPAQAGVTICVEYNGVKVCVELR